MKKTLMMLVGAFALVACGYDWDYRVQYVRIPKGGYFNSGVSPTVGTKVTMSVAINADATIDVFGTPTRTAGCMIFNVTKADSDPMRPGIYYRYGQQNANAFAGSMTVGFRHDIECTADIVLDGTTIQTVADGMGTGNAETFTFPGTYWNDSESVFYFKVEHGGTVDCELIPCVKGGTPCFYDTVSDSYKYMTGSGTPEAGPQVNDDGTHLAQGNTILEPDGEGWYTFGNPSYTSSDYKCPTMVYPRWTNLHIAATAKIRLVGGVVLDPIPSAATLDITSTKAVFAHYHNSFPGTAFTVPSGMTYRYGPGTIGGTDGALTYSMNSAKTITSDVENNGLIWASDGCSTTYWFAGRVTGTGKFRTYNFTRNFVFNGTGAFAFNGEIEHAGGANGSYTQISKSTIEGEISKFTTESVGWGKWATNGYCQIRLLFQPSAGTIATPLRIKTYVPSAGGGGFCRSIYEGGKWYRYGHAICIKDDNRVVIGTAAGGFQVIDDDALANTKRNWTGTPTIEIGNLGNSSTASAMYLTTNLNVIVTNIVNNGTKVDFNGYTNIATSVNRSWFRVYGTTAAQASIYARTPAFLPHELTGFAGRLCLSADADVWNFPVDFDAHTAAEYAADPNLANLDGCQGSGTIYTMPASGTVNVSITATGERPPKGRYPLMTCTDGANLDAWTVNVTVNGQAHANIGGDEVYFLGRSAKILREATGLWLRIGSGGTQVILH